MNVTLIQTHSYTEYICLRKFTTAFTGDSGQDVGIVWYVTSESNVLK